VLRNHFIPRSHPSDERFKLVFHMILLSRHQWYLEFNKVLEFSTFLSSKEEVFGSVEQYLSSKEEVFDSVEQYLSQK